MFGYEYLDLTEGGLAKVVVPDDFETGPTRAGPSPSGSPRPRPRPRPVVPPAKGGQTAPAPSTPGGFASAAPAWLTNIQAQGSASGSGSPGMLGKRRAEALGPEELTSVGGSRPNKRPRSTSADKSASVVGSTGAQGAKQVQGASTVRPLHKLRKVVLLMPPRKQTAPPREDENMVAEYEPLPFTAMDTDPIPDFFDAAPLPPPTAATPGVGTDAGPSDPSGRQRRPTPPPPEPMEDTSENEDQLDDEGPAVQGKGKARASASGSARRQRHAQRPSGGGVAIYDPPTGRRIASASQDELRTSVPHIH